MKKRIFGKVACLFMSVAMAFGITACAPTENDDDNTPDEGDPVTYTVSFDLQGHGSPQPDDQTVEEGGYATRPATDPTDTAYNFGGWYKESETTNEFKFAEEKIEKDTTVYAKWTKKEEPPVDDPTKDTSSPLASTVKIYLVGDSTVCDYATLDMEYLPRSGYGTQLYNYLNCQPSQIVNLALSGRSSLSFLTEDNYETLKTSIKEGDYLIIGFGHNDEKVGEEARYTDPTGTYQEATKNGSPSFQYILYENYVKVAKDAKATPILCTPIVRCSTSTPLTGDKIHATATGNYADAIKKLAQDTETALVDLTAITKAIYESDIAEAQYFHRHSTYDGEKPNETPAGIDNTHLNAYGAKVVAYALLHNLPDGCKLKDSVITNIPAPTHENDYADAKHPTYEKPNYSAPTLSNPIYTTQSGEEDVKWYAAAIGDNGGTSKHSATYNTATQTFRVGNTKTDSDPAGKFTSAGDGFVAAFVQVPISRNFVISADVNLEEELRADNQSAFGIMLRDDMYAPGNFKNLKSNFVAVGAFDATATSAIFYRRAEALTSEKGKSTTFSTDKTYKLKLTRNGQNTILEFDDGTNEHTLTYMDFAMNSIDGEYMYICLFASRGVIADFSNVVLTYTGDQTQED